MVNILPLYAIIVKAPVAFMQNVFARFGHLVRPTIVAMGQNDILAQFKAFAPFVEGHSHSHHEKRQKDKCQHFHALNMSVGTRQYKIGATPC